MDATTSGWIAAYLQWADGDEGAIEAPGSAPVETFETECFSCEESAAAFLEWMATASFGRRAGDRAARATWTGDTAGLEGFREAMLLAALQSEADCLHLLRHAVDDEPSPSPATRLIVEALADADRLCRDEQRAWSALAMLRRGELASPYARDGRYAAETWPQALESVAGDVRALAAKVLSLRLH